MSKQPLLEAKGIEASVGEKKLLHGIDLTVYPGEVHVIMGPNGSGKSTFANVLMANPVYELDQGTICLDGEDITELSTDKRAQKGLFLSFQSPREVDGITLENFIRQAQTARGEDQSLLKYHKALDKEMELLSMKPEYKSRYLNLGFSGGEKKKSEILQLLMLDPKVAILDETDSGLDVDAVRIVSQGIKEFLTEDKAAIIITHHREILKEIEADKVHVISNGCIVAEGGDEIMDRVEEEGFGWIINTNEVEF